MAAEIRVDTIKGRSGINTFSFKGDGFSFDQKVGIGTTVASDPVTVVNAGKLSVGVASVRNLYVGLVTSNYGSGYSYVNVGTGVSVVGVSTFLNQVDVVGVTTFFNQVNVGTAATFNQNGNATISGITTLGGTSHVRIPVGTTGQRPGTAQVGDFRYNSTEDEFEGYSDGAWGAIGGGASETDTSVSSTSATAVYTVAHASYRSASLILQITQGSAYQSGRYMVIHDGTTATIVEEAAIATGSMLGTFTASIVSSNLIVYVNMGSSSSATVTVIPTPVTV